MIVRRIVTWLRDTLKQFSRIPLENQLLRSENKRLAQLAARMQRERDRWVQMHQAAGTAFQASQEIMIQKIAELSMKVGVEPDPMFREIVAEYAKVHGTMRPEPYPDEKPTRSETAAVPAPAVSQPAPSVEVPLPDPSTTGPHVIRSSQVRAAQRARKPAG